MVDRRTFTTLLVGGIAAPGASFARNFQGEERVLFRRRPGTHTLQHWRRWSRPRQARHGVRRSWNRWPGPSPMRSEKPWNVAKAIRRNG